MGGITKTELIGCALVVMVIYKKLKLVSMWSLLALLTGILTGCELLQVRQPAPVAPAYTVPLEARSDVLSEFGVARRGALINELAKSGIWSVVPAPQKQPLEALIHLPWRPSTQAILRMTPSYFLDSKDKFVKEAVGEIIHPETRKLPAGTYVPPSYGGGGGFNQGDETCYMQVFLFVRDTQDRSTVPVENDNEAIAVSESFKLSAKGNLWAHSTVQLAGSDLAIFVQESSYSNNRQYTREAVDFVLRELKKTKALLVDGKGKTGELVSEQALKIAQDNQIKVASGAVSGYINCGEPGVVTLSVIPGAEAKSKSFNWGTDGAQQIEAICGWSKEAQQKYFFAIPWTLPGDGDARLEQFGFRLTFQPLDPGHPVRVLFDQAPLR